MARNNSHAVEILKRREVVASKRLRGWTQRQIAEFVCVGLATVNRDLQAIEEDWRAASVATIDAHKSRILAELAEVKRAAWSDRNLSAVLSALKQEADVLGVDAPVKVEHSGGIEVTDAREELERRYSQLAAVREPDAAYRQPN